MSDLQAGASGGSSGNGSVSAALPNGGAASTGTQPVGGTGSGGAGITSSVGIEAVGGAGSTITNAQISGTPGVTIPAANHEIAIGAFARLEEKLKAFEAAAVADIKGDIADIKALFHIE